MSKMEVELEIIDNYEPALSLFIKMLEQGHKRHGLEFRHRPYHWMMKRIRQERIEYQDAKAPEDKAAEALDVSILWFLIAQKRLTEGH